MSDADRLYELLPVVHRQRDAEQGFPLRALLRILGEQVGVVEDDIAQLYENWFIETCEDWVVPYIADLIGWQPVAAAGGPGGAAEGGQPARAAARDRREVANTLRYRRRKGTLALLAEMARDVAGWPARAVELYPLLARTQHVRALRPGQGGSADLRRGAALDALDGPFARLAHHVDVRRPGSRRTVGRFNIPSVALFAWRLRSYPVTRSPAYCLEEAGPHCYTFSALGNDTPLYVAPRPEPGQPDSPTALELPVPILRRAFAAHLEDYYGPDKSVHIWVGTAPDKGSTESVRRPLAAAQIVVADLADWRYVPRRGQVAVDPERGRIAFPPRQLPKGGVWVTYSYGACADLGGGEYERPMPRLSAAAVSRFRAGDLKDPPAFAAWLATSSEPLPRYLRERLGSETRQLLAAYPGGGKALPEALLAALLAELNLRLADQELYADERFPADQLKPAVSALLAESPEGARRVRLNRLLLETVLPDRFVASFAFYRVGERPDLVPRPEYQRLGDALDRFRRDQPRHAIVEIADSGVYVEAIAVTLGPGQTLELRAAQRTRPVLHLLDRQTDLPDPMGIKGEAGSSFTLDGLLVTGRSVAISGDLASVSIRHCTLMPGLGMHHDCTPRRPSEPSLELVDVPGCVVVEHSILGAVEVTMDEVKTEPVPLVLRDSVLDATRRDRQALHAPGAVAAHARLRVERSTVIGEVQVHALELASDSLFLGLLRVARRQIGCMRFCSYVPGSRPPRRFACQPDLAVAAAPAGLAERERRRVRPLLDSTRYGTPTYCRLADAGAPEIRRGAADESEMGVYHDLFQPQRDLGLRTRLGELTPAGSEAGVIYVT